MKRYFITGIGTGVGKTIASAVVVEALQADYWKPIQSGDLDNSDTLKVQSLVKNSKSVFHPEAFRLTSAMSPHVSARLDGVKIELTDFTLPNTSNNIVIEGAGGLMVPINDAPVYMIDLIKKLEANVILVVSNYLGSINHTLLSLSLIQQYNLPLKGVIVSGVSNSESESVIEKYMGKSILFRIPQIDRMDASEIHRIASVNEVSKLLV